MRKIIVTMGLAASLATACTKEPLKHMTDEESRIYITNHDSTINFRSFATYSIADSVAVITNSRLERKALTDVDSAFINAVKQQMQQLNYQLVPKNQNPDLGINVSRIVNVSTGVFSYVDYSDYYYGYYDPYYWGYPGYGYYFPTFYGTYQVAEGAMSVDMLDLKDASASQQIKAIWSGLIRGSGIFNAATAPSQVKALFDQSPYLNAN